MAILKKIKSSTLIEALVATMLILIIFIISSMIINNLLFNNISKETHQAEYRLEELRYKIQNRIIRLPYKETFKGWEIQALTSQAQENVWMTATKKDKTISKKWINEY